MMKFGMLLLALAHASEDVNMDFINAKFAEMQHVIDMQRLMLEEHDSLLSSGHSRRLNATNATVEGNSIYGDAEGEVPYTPEEHIALALDHMWLIICGALVMFMQAGFAMVESGCCRAKNVQNILLKNLTDVCVGTLGWWAAGWGFAYGGPYDEDGNLASGFIGGAQFFGSGFIEYLPDGQFQGTDIMMNWFFQWAFCSAAATIVSGGVAERVNFPGYCVFTLAMTCFVYPLVVAWTWGYGFLGANNYMDFAGSSIVHMVGGVGALVGAAVAGPRTGRWANPDSFQAHSLPLVVLGTFILWFGWYGFNCGSTLALPDQATGQLAAFVAMNTTIAAATGGLTVFLLRFARLRKYDIGGFCNGILAGLVSITAPCGNVECGSAFAIAIIGGFVYEGASSLLRKLKIDDPIDAFAVHGACGAWGTLAAVLFDMGAVRSGFDQYNAWSGFSCNLDDDGKCAKGAWGDGFAINAAGVVTIAAWTAFWSALIFAPLRVSGQLRASDELQDAGFDSQKHSPPKAYAVEAPLMAAPLTVVKETKVEEQPTNQPAEAVAVDVTV